MPIDEDARGEVHLALESRMVELIREGCRGHLYGCGVGGGVTPSRNNEGEFFGYKAEDYSNRLHNRANPGHSTGFRQLNLSVFHGTTTSYPACHGPRR